MPTFDRNHIQYVEAQQRLNAAAMMIVLYGADISRLKELNEAWLELTEVTQSLEARVKGARSDG